MKLNIINERFEKKGEIKRGATTLKHNIINKKLRFIIIVFILFIKTKINDNNLINYIHLALNIDNNYVYPCIIYLTSVLTNRAKSSFYIFHILIEDNIKNETLDKIKLTVERLGNDYSNVSFYKMGNQFIRATVSHVSRAGYYRIALPSLLPDVDKIIYTDSDVIN